MLEVSRATVYRYLSDGVWLARWLPLRCWCRSRLGPARRPRLP